MADIQDQASAEPGQDQHDVRLSPQEIQAWIAQQQARLDRGLPLAPNGIPAGYAVHDGKIVEKTWWDNYGQAVLGMAGVAAGGALLPAAGAGAATGAGAGAADAAASALPSTAIDAGLFTAPTTTASGAVDAALAGGGAGAATGAATGALPSTQIGNGIITAPSSVPSGAVPSASSTGLPDWLKQSQDLGSQLSSISAGQAQGRNFDSIANIGYANAQNDLYNSELKAPQQIAHNAVKGDILSNARDVSIAAPSDIPVPQISGGLRPSMFSDTTRQLGKDITAGAAATPRPTPTPPVLQPMETAGVGSNILNDASMVTNLAGPTYGLLSKIPWGSIF